MSNLIGVWIFTALLYKGEVIPPPNPNLHIFMTFQNQVQNEIYYYRSNESGFCRRLANYNLNEDILEQTVTYVDPENNSECSMDTDMQLNNYSKVHYYIKNEQLHLELTLGEENIEYIFDKKSID